MPEADFGTFLANCFTFITVIHFDIPLYLFSKSHRLGICNMSLPILPLTKWKEAFGSAFSAYVNGPLVFQIFLFYFTEPAILMAAHCLHCSSISQIEIVLIWIFIVNLTCVLQGARIVLLALEVDLMLELLSNFGKCLAMDRDWKRMVFGKVFVNYL